MIGVFSHLLYALIFGILVEAAFGGWKRYRDWLLSARAWWRISRTGLKGIYPRSNSRSVQVLQSILQDATDGDEILLVGRTQKDLLQNNEELIMGALERGSNVKLLFLDQRLLANPGLGQHVDLRSLGLPNAYRYSQLVNDLGEAEAKLLTLRERCRHHKVRGSFLVYRTGVLVQNSIVVLVPCKKSEPMRLVYDFSFGAKPSDKFVQYYRSARRKSNDDFCCRVHDFYVGLLDPDVSSFAYGLSYRYSRDNDPAREIQKIAAERMTTLIEQNVEQETIRNNNLFQIVPTAAKVFGSLTGDIPVPAPLSAQIELTNECSTSCKHCFRYSSKDNLHMDTAFGMGILRQLRDFNVRTITFSGGEPTRHPDFVKLLKYAAKDMGMSVGVLSNGVGVTTEVLCAIHSYAKWLRLSIDGSANVYGHVRSLVNTNESAFWQVDATIKEFLTLNNDPHTCRLTICYTIQSSNVADLPDMITWVRKLGIPDGDKCLTFKFAHGRRAGFLCTPMQLHALHTEVLSKPKDSSMPDFSEAANISYLRRFLEHQSSVLDVAEGRPTQSLYLQQPTRCFTPYLFTLIDPQGDVYPCCFLFEDNQGYTPEAVEKRKAHCVGHLKDETFVGIWNGTKYQQVRRELASINPKREKYAACGECTRHCNHNRGLSQLYAEYSGLKATARGADSVLEGIVGERTQNEVWL